MHDAVSFESRYIHALMRYEQGAVAEAADLLTITLQEFGAGHWPSVETLAHWLLELRDYERAESLLEQTEALYSRERGWQELQILVWLGLNDTELALEALEALEQRHGDAPWVLCLRAQWWMTHARWTLALDTLTYALKRLDQQNNPEPALSKNALELAVRCWARLQEPRQAMEWLDNFAALLPESTETLVLFKALCLAQQNRWQERLILLEQSVEGLTLSQAPRCFEALGEAYLELGEQAKARQLLEALHLQAPESSVIERLAIKSLFFQQRWKELLHRLQQGPASSLDAFSRFAMAVAFAQSNQFTLALQCLQQLALREEGPSLSKQALARLMAPTPPSLMDYQNSLTRFALALQEQYNPELERSFLSRWQAYLPWQPPTSLTYQVSKPQKALRQYSQGLRAALPLVNKDGGTLLADKSARAKDTYRFGVCLTPTEPLWAQVAWLTEFLASVSFAKGQAVAVYAFIPPELKAPYNQLAGTPHINSFKQWHSVSLPPHPGAAAEIVRNYELDELFLLNPLGDSISYTLPLAKPSALISTGGPFVPSSTELPGVDNWYWFASLEEENAQQSSFSETLHGCRFISTDLQTTGSSLNAHTHDVCRQALLTQLDLPLHAFQPIKAGATTERAPYLIGLLAWPFQLNPELDAVCMGLLQQAPNAVLLLPYVQQRGFLMDYHGPANLHARLSEVNERLMERVRWVPLSTAESWQLFLSGCDSLALPPNGGCQWAVPYALKQGTPLHWLQQPPSLQAATYAQQCLQHIEWSHFQEGSLSPSGGLQRPLAHCTASELDEFRNALRLVATKAFSTVSQALANTQEALRLLTSSEEQHSTQN